MKDYPISKYRFYTDKKSKVIAVSTYEGKTVRGVAKCDPRDGFDLEKGKTLAAARCCEKIAAKRASRAKKEYDKAKRAYDAAERRLMKMNDYLLDAKAAAVASVNNAEQLQKKM